MSFGFRYACLAALCAIPVAAQAPIAAQAVAPTPQTPLPWAYPLSPPAPAAVPGAPAPPPDPTLWHVPNSTKAFSRAQVTDGFNPPDWHPEDHPPMPEIVGHGRPKDVRACGYCHLPNGQGRPENASLTGLPAAYIIQQVNDYKAGLRKSSEPAMGPPDAMLKLAKATNEDEVKIAAEYFSKLKYKPWISVVESKTAPKTRVATGMLVPLEGHETEPLGQRIVETAEHLEPTELRDSGQGSGFVAYVPVGSIKKGEDLVTKGGAGKTLRCSICHGQDLKGLGNVPFLAGRSPSYLVANFTIFSTGAGRDRGVL